MKTLPSGSLQVAENRSFTDDELDDLVSHLWENIDGLPGHIQELLHETQQPGKVGAVSFALLTGWALGKFEYEVGDPWGSTKSGWMPKDKNVN